MSGKDTPQYKTLFRNQADLADALGDLDGVALRLANKLLEKKVIGKAVRDSADIHGPHVTEIMRVNPIIKAVLAMIDLDAENYNKFRSALLSDAVGVHEGIVKKYVPKGMIIHNIYIVGNQRHPMTSYMAYTPTVIIEVLF